MNLDKSNLIGRSTELFAIKKYQALGFKILNKNFFNRRGKRVGEIDFIAVKNNQIRFVEVKARSSGRFGCPEELFDWRKQLKVKKAISYFLLCFPRYRGFGAHIDLVAIELSQFDNSVRKFRIYADCIF